MKMKKIMGLLLVCVMLITSLAACSSKGNTDNNENPQTENTGGETDKDGTDTGSNPGEVVTLKWLAVGNEQPDNYDAWIAVVNPYLEEKIGVNIDMEIVPWGEWENRRSVLINSGEYFDILFTDQGRYDQEVALGSFMDITELIKTSAPDLYEYIPEDNWKGVSINDKIYSIPTYKDSSLTNWVCWDNSLLKKYNIDGTDLNTFAKLDQPLRTIKDGEGTAPFYLNKNGVTAPMTDHMDIMGTGIKIIGVKYDDQERKVINLLEDEDFLSNMDIVHEWYKYGVINADAPSVDEAPKYKMMSIAQGWSASAPLNWGPNQGIEDCVAYQFSKTMLSNATVRGSVNAIYSGCKNPEKALEFLQLVNLDTKLRDWYYFGVEGDNFEYDADGRIHRINFDWDMAGYTQGTYFTVTRQDNDTEDQWQEVRKLNESATPSVLLGFNLDRTKIETELVNCRAVWDKYRSELMTGSKEPRAMAQTMTEELKKAGMETVMTEMQAQIDAWAATQQ